MDTDETTKLINNELTGKNAAIHAYDKMIWKVRAGFLTLVFGAWRLAVKATMAVSPGIPQKAWCK